VSRLLKYPVSLVVFMPDLGRVLLDVWLFLKPYVRPVVDFLSIPEVIVFCVFLTAFLATFHLTKRFISRFHQGGYVVKDMYKFDKPKIPTMGGIALIGGVMVSLVASIILLGQGDLIEWIMILYFVIFIYGMFGLLDDLIQVKSRFKRVYILYLLALPVALLNVDTTIRIAGYELPLGWAFSYIIAPVYVMVVANMINMHAGFNGLSGGLTLILIFFTGLKAYMKFGVESLHYIVPVFGGLLAFMWFNRYPSKIFLGNSGTYMIGASLGGLIIVYSMEWFGVFILIPHIINFLMWIYWLTQMHIHPHKKFAEIREDGTIKPPNKLTMKYLITSLLQINEKKATIILYTITTVFCIIGIIIVP
jgi:UDP-N-acetylglucosamine--dolichyl-phosphate N-acetylglucosaminephosphotransferase